MPDDIHVNHYSMNLAQYTDRWQFDDAHACWCLEDILYTPIPLSPAFQRLSIFAPKGCVNMDGTPTDESRTIPVVFENNAAGYMQMPNTWPGGPRWYGDQYLKHGLIYVSCGCRGRDSYNEKGEPVGKAPETLIDLKTALRFLRHNQKALPGDWSRVISVGWSAGGAMSALLGVTGDHPDYVPYLQVAGAFMDESDAVFASQIYCPIINLEHADMAYEWMFRADPTCEDSPSGPVETMTPFKEALSRQLSRQYVDYLNSLGLLHPETGEKLLLNPDGRSGSFYDYFMEQINRSASEYLIRLGNSQETEKWSPQDYLTGNYTCLVPVLRSGAAHHAGQEVALTDTPRPRGLGEMLLRSAQGQEIAMPVPQMEEKRGTDKRAWLSWDGQSALVSDLDAYVLAHRRRMKPCTAFDKLPMDSGENHEFGDQARDYRHFSASVAYALEALQKDYPEEARPILTAYERDLSDAVLKERVRLLNSLLYIADEKAHHAKYFRIRVGARDADTSFSVSMTLSLLLHQAGYDADYALIWDVPHSEADYPGEILAWIDRICGNKEA